MFVPVPPHPNPYLYPPTPFASSCFEIDSEEQRARFRRCSQSSRRTNVPGSAVICRCVKRAIALDRALMARKKEDSAIELYVYVVGGETPGTSSEERCLMVKPGKCGKCEETRDGWVNERIFVDNGCTDQNA